MNEMTSRIERLKHMARYVPAWLPSILILVAVLWLTLAPHPVGDMDVPLFEGADKVVHAAMFMVLTFAVLFDLMRTRGWQQVSLPVISVVVFAAGLLGILTECLQNVMGTGRSMEILDMGADFIGAVFGGVIWIIYQSLHLFAESDKERESDQ